MGQSSPRSVSKSKVCPIWCPLWQPILPLLSVTVNLILGLFPIASLPLFLNKNRNNFVYLNSLIYFLYIMTKKEKMPVERSWWINRSVYLLDENLKLNRIGFISENYVKRRRAHVWARRASLRRSLSEKASAASRKRSVSLRQSLNRCKTFISLYDRVANNYLTVT